MRFSKKQAESLLREGERLEDLFIEKKKKVAWSTLISIFPMIRTTNIEEITVYEPKQSIRGEIEVSYEKVPAWFLCFPTQKPVYSRKNI